MNQPPPDRAPEEQGVHALRLRDFTGWNNDHRIPEIGEHPPRSLPAFAPTWAEVGSMARELLRLRARAVADEAAAQVVEAARALEAHLDLHSREGAGDVRTCINCYHRRRDMQRALAATRAGNETNKAGAGSTSAGTVNVDTLAAPMESSGSAATPDTQAASSQSPTPATSAAEATAEAEAGSREADHRVAWSRAKGMALLLHDKSRSFIEERVYALLRDMLTERRAALDSHAAAAVKRAREECEAHIAVARRQRNAAQSLAEDAEDESASLRAELARAVAAKEHALADRDRMQALVDREVAECERLRDEVAGLKAAAQPARQPAASGEDIALVQRLAADLWHQDFCPWPKFNGDGVSREGECCCDFVEVERRVQEWLAKRLDRFLAARAAAGARP